MSSLMEFYVNRRKHLISCLLIKYIFTYFLRARSAPDADPDQIDPVPVRI
jgi:hypothetical protein